MLSGLCSNCEKRYRFCPYRYVVFDRAAKFSEDVLEFLLASGVIPMRTAVHSPWQNGIAERWVGSVRREMLDHVIPLNERHLRRLGREYLAYYHEDRTHVGLDKTTSSSRTIELRPTETSRIQSRLESAVFITATIGQTLPDSRHNIPVRSCFSAQKTNLAQQLG